MNPLAKFEHHWKSRTEVINKSFFSNITPGFTVLSLFDRDICQNY